MSESGKTRDCETGLLWSFLGNFIYTFVVNPFMPNGFFYFNFLDRSISYIEGVWLVFIVAMFCRNIWT